ncbi:MAG: hypothetical protein KC680_00970 [Candidatus Peregrinibacteria bacterium]|nr:hypothetical protein [Candidatus Peregrinibacteria bacterium]MCB9808108.1 hypothetical protein [Candidatus Peribacteria bacterium]
MDIKDISRKRFLSTVVWGVLASVIIVGAAAGIGRATVNLQGALTNKPDIAIYLLLPDEGIGKIEVLKEEENERHYLADTSEGKKFIILKKGQKEWYVSDVQSLHDDEPTAPSAEEQEAENEQ